MTGSAGIRMHAPGHAPMGPPSAGAVDVGVFPEDLERATELLGDWPGRDAIIEAEEEEDDGPPPAKASLSAQPPLAASKAPQSTSPIAVVLLVAAVGAIVAAWIVSTAR